MSEKIRKLLIIKLHAFPSGEWLDQMRRNFGADYGKKSEPDFPTWMRIRGKGYILWVSDMQNSVNKDEWIIALERSKNLNREGIEKEEEFLGFAKKFFEKLEIKEEAIS